jgi:uncharacterized sulfatase
MMAFIDDRLGAIMRTLEETGQAENTVIVFTSDHGELHGHHGLWHKGLTAYDDCQRVPLLAWGAGVQPRGTTDALANLVDLPRTIMALAGAEAPLGIQGADLSPVLRGEADRVQDETLIEFQATHKVFQYTMVTDTHKLIVYRDSDEGELYDRAADPDQYENLWNRPEHAALKTRLLQQFLQAVMRQTGKQPERLSFA